MGSTLRKGSEQTGQSAGLSMDQSRMMQDLWGNGGRNLAVEGAGNALNFLQRGTVPDTQKSTIGIGAPLAQQAQEMQAARTGILNNTARGGLQQRMLAEMPIQRMLNNDNLQAQARGIDDQTRQNMFNQAMSMSMGQAPTVIQGMSGAANNLNSLGQQRIGQNSQMLGGAGQLAGSLGKGAMMMCWIAERFYGPTDYRTYQLRAWFLEDLSWWGTKLYIRHGLWISKQWWCPLLRPVFAVCLRFAQGAH